MQGAVSGVEVYGSPKMVEPVGPPPLAELPLPLYNSLLLEPAGYPRPLLAG